MTSCMHSSMSNSLCITGKVVRLDHNDQMACVSCDQEWSANEVWAQLAVGSQCVVDVGDTVVLVGHGTEHVYVIGNLTRKPARVATSTGTYAERRVGQDGSETMCVMSADDAVLFEHDVTNGRTRVRVPNGTLELSSGSGDLVLRSRGAIRMEAESLEFLGRTKINLALRKGKEIANSWLKMAAGTLQMGSEQFSLTAHRGDVRISKATLQGTSLSTEADVVEVKARKLVSVIETLVERFGNAYRSVSGLMQVQTSRLRHYVSGISHYRSQRAYFSAEESFNINGDKIHLG